MKQQINMELLKQVDEAAEERIAKEFPANWEKGDLFEKAYQNYLELTEKEQKPAVSVRRHIMRIVSTAACCIVVLGAAYAIRSEPHQLPTVPEESTTETSALSTEYSENTSAIAETEKETEPVPTTEDFRLEETVTETDSMTINTAPAVITDMGTVTEAATLPESIAVTEPPTAEMQTEPPQTLPSETTETESAILPGFEVKHQDGKLEITYLEQVSPSPDGFQDYWVDSERFLLEIPEAMPEGPSRSYHISMLDGSGLFEIFQTKRDVFCQTCSENVLLLPADVNGHPAYYVVESDQQPASACTLYWDDGYYTFSMRDTVQNQKLMLRIAEALVRADV